MATIDKRVKYQSDDEKLVTISMRLPKDLHTRLVRYAHEHRQGISELVRDGLEWRLTEGDPRGLGDVSATDDGAYYMSNTAEALAGLRQALARQEAQIQAIAQALERQANGERHTLYSTTEQGDDDRLPVSAPEPPSGAEIQDGSHTGISDGRHAGTPDDHHTRIPDDRNAGIQKEVPAFDRTRYRLGKLCPKGHDYYGTGQSLRVNNKVGYCIACNTEHKRESRVRQSQQKHQAHG
jgi:hypothetical protein